MSVGKSWVNKLQFISLVEYHAVGEICKLEPCDSIWIKPEKAEKAFAARHSV